MVRAANTLLGDRDRPFAILANNRTDGAVSLNGRAVGTYLHGLSSPQTPSRPNPAPAGQRDKPMTT